MGHLLSSALKMQTSAAPATASIQYQFTENSIGGMNIFYNGDTTFLASTTGLTTDTLTPASQTISSAVSPFEAGGSADILYYINDVFIDSYYGFETTAQSGDKTTSAGNTYKFVGSTAF